MDKVTVPISSSSSSSSDDKEEIHVSPEESTRLFNEQADELEKASQAHIANHTADLDKAHAGEQPFNLREYFKNSHLTAASNGGKPKRMGVTVKDLTVIGQAPEDSVISTNLTPIISLLNLFNPWWWLEKTPTTQILQDINAYAKDGEMLLVLGRPGSGCSTFLRVLANQRGGFVDVQGEVNYGGLSADEFKHFRGEAIYTPEEDCHFPFLTLKETLDFALKCKTPGNRLSDESPAEFRERMIKLLTTMFGLQKQVNTWVGNEFIRGLSGGERKRLTLMEAMVAQASITCWDNSTRGLDAASAYDYVKCLRVMTDVLGKTTVCSFYQASENIYNLFDKVIVFDKGKQIYYGPTKEAKKYFVDLGFVCEPRKSTPDFLTGVTNFQERIFQKGFEDKAPQTSAEFENVWKKSPDARRVIAERDSYEKEIEINQPSADFKEEVKAQKRSFAPNSTVYTASFFTVVGATFQRSALLKLRDKFSLYTNYLSVLVQAFIYSSVFFLMPLDEAGLYSRGGALFGAVLLNALIFVGEITGVFMGRLTLVKHRSYAMYPPMALHMGQMLADIPFVLVQSFLFSFITYFMYGLVLNASKFFIYTFVLVVISLCFISLFRLVGNLTPSLFFAQQIQNLIIVLMITYCGFIIPYSKMHPWFQWIFWINPISYGIMALFNNEVSGLDFSCNASAVPYGDGYTDSAYRVCAQSGAIAGNLSVSGNDYLTYGLNYYPEYTSLWICVIVMLWILFTVLNCIAMQVLEWTGGGYTRKVYKRGKAPKGELDEKAVAQMVSAATADMGTTLITQDSTFLWRDVCYTVPVPKPEKKRQLLDHISGWIKPGQMTALMGASGAGKTTLLDVLALRKTTGKITGERYLNGKPLQVDFKRITGYAEQMDVFNPACTVREALQFSATLRQEFDVPHQEKMDYVESILEMMEMKHLGDAQIGSLDSGVGISVEERKRLTIGLELVAKPHILFLDEPTSGLDAQSSFNIIKFIRKLADTGMPLVCTIHQPSSVLFEHFDRLLLLAKGGKTVYFGDIGPQSKTLTGYFETRGVRKCSKDENPAEYILEAIGAGVNGKSDKNWPEEWLSSSEQKKIDQDLNALLVQGKSLPERDEAPIEFATPIWFQFWEVYKRLNIVFWRDPFYNAGRVLNGIFVGILLGFSYWNLEDSVSDMRSRIFLLFQACLVGILLIFASLPVFYMQREFFRRDYAAKIYSWGPFGLAIVLVEIPYVILVTTLTFICIYWASGLHKQNTSDTAGYLYFAMVIFTSYCVALGQSIAAVCTHIIQAILIIPVVILFLFLFCGVLNPPSSMPYFWRSWMYPLDPTRYYLEGVVSNVLYHIKLNCTDADLAKFPAPPNMTCGEYTANFLANGTGYIANPLASGAELCEYCIYSAGPEYYENFVGWSYDNRWRDLGIVVCYWFAAVLVTIAFTYVNRKGFR